MVVGAAVLPRTAGAAARVAGAVAGAAAAQEGGVTRVFGPSWWARRAWAWGVRRKITDGTRPDGHITREQVVTMLYRALVGLPDPNAAWA